MTLHSTIAAGSHADPRDVCSLEEARALPAAARSSLLGQYAAHLALLRFAGMHESFDPSDWRVVRRRGDDVRLLRTAMRRNDGRQSELALVDSFRAAVDAPGLLVLDTTWARSDRVYTEVFRTLMTTGREWASLVESASGLLLAPGIDELRATFGVAGGSAAYDDIRLVERLATLMGDALFFVAGRDASPLVPFSAFPQFAGSGEPPAAIAERVYTAFASQHCTIAVCNIERFDSPSREVVDILRDFPSLSWLLPRDPDASTPAARLFVVSPTLQAAERLREVVRSDSHTLDAFMAKWSDATVVARFLEHGELPELTTAAAALEEPRRSYVSALAVAGEAMPLDAAKSFLEAIGCATPPDELAPGVVAVADGEVRFVSRESRSIAENSVPPAFRESLARLAISLLSRFGYATRAATLLVRLGRHDEALEALGETLPPPDELISFPRELVARSLPLTNAAMRELIGRGQYLDALSFEQSVSDPEHQSLCAMAERRLGRYAAALSRLASVSGHSATLLRGELLRLTGDLPGAVAELEAALREEHSDRALFELGLCALDGESAELPEAPAHPYFSARLEAYRLLAAGEHSRAREAALAAAGCATSNADQVDAELDLLYADFLAGEWDSARLQARRILTLCEETQGDRAAAGALFTLAYLSADEGLWEDAESRIERLRVFYERFRDERRMRELDLLDAALRFNRGDFDAASRFAASVASCDGAIGAAARLIVAECEWLAGAKAPFSERASNCRELADRQAILKQRIDGTTAAPHGSFNRALAEWERAVAAAAANPPEPPFASSTSERLKLFRAAAGWAAKSASAPLRALAATLANETGAMQRAENTSGAIASSHRELELLQRLSRDAFPFDQTFLSPWLFASRNRLGTWTVIGNEATASQQELDELLAAPGADCLPITSTSFLRVEGAGLWSAPTRDAIAATFRTKWEHHNQRRLLSDEVTEPARAPLAIEGIVGSSPAIRGLLETIRRVARADATVTITGESGTGKELVARALHRLSSRRSEPFVPVNCAALPENLIESELFGHARGAFTGADRDRAGLIEAADRGTLFLDEIGELPLAAQAKLLRFLQEHEIRRVGDSVTRKADVRVVAATHRELERLVEDGRFREDLFYRIKVIELKVPPLRERGDDVIALARSFLATERSRSGAGPDRFTENVEALFLSYGWKGNVRELQNTVRAAYALAGESRVVDVSHLPERIAGAAVVRRSGSFHDEVTRFRRTLIEDALLKADGNQNRAAKLLGMSRQALGYQIRELRIRVSR